MSKSLRIVFSTVLVLVSPLAVAEAPTAEPALTITFTDEQLKWGPCPDFIPQGREIAVLHGDPAKENADVFFRIPANFTIPEHWHTSAERMVLVSGELEVTYEGQEMTKLRPGTYAYGPAKLPHKAFCAKGERCILFIAFESPVDAVPTNSSAQERIALRSAQHGR